MKPAAEQSSPPEGSVPVAIYTRVSTDNQVGGRFDSCDSQLAICQDHIRKCAALGWAEVAHYSDPAVSGSSMDRFFHGLVKYAIAIAFATMAQEFFVSRQLQCIRG